MGSNSASTGGGGGGVGPAGIKTDGTYGTKKDAKKASSRNELRTAIKNFDEDERIVSDINQIINEDLNDPDAFGVKGYITKISNDLAAAVGMGAQEWSELDAAKRTQLILDVTAQRSVRNILGESGKTISNLDREIVAKIFGSVGIFTSPAEIKKKLETSRKNIIEGMRSGQNAIISRTQGLKNLKYPSNLVDANESIIDRIMKFEIYNRVQTFELMLAMFIICGVAVIVIDIIDEITKEKTDE